MYRVFLWFAAVSCSCALLAAQNIRFDEGRKVWLITTQHSSYAMGVAPSGQLQHLYWGAPLWRMEDIPSAQAAHDISSFDPHEMI